MNKNVLTCLMLFASLIVLSQNSFKKNDIYGEFLGNSLIASINYERQLTASPGLGLRAGIGYASGDEKFRIAIPLGINYLFSLTPNKSFLDAGIGATWSGAEVFTTLQQEVAAGGEDYSKIWTFVPSIGYRRHTKGSFMWRTSFTPIFNKYRTVPWVGISVGKRF